MTDHLSLSGVPMNRTGALNTTVTIGGQPCPKCGTQEATTTDFHGWLGTFCVACGEELPHA